MRRVLATAVVMLAACGGEAPDRATTNGVQVEAAWARVTGPAQTVGAVYFEIESVADDALTAVRVAPVVARAAEVHESVVDDAGDSTSAGDGMPKMTMRKVETLALPRGDPVSFRSGGYHLMLVDLAEPLLDGESFEITLEFEHAGPLTVEVPIAESQP